MLDSFSASFFGSDQNDVVQVMEHYRDLKKFALTEVGAKGLIVITHSTKAKPTEPRGSSAHTDTADTMVLVVEEPTTGKRKVTMEKYREARGFKPMSPVLVGAPDSATHLMDVDAGAMVMVGLQPPAGAEMFDTEHEEYEAPESGVYQEGEEEEL